MVLGGNFINDLAGQVIQMVAFRLINQVLAGPDVHEQHIRRAVISPNKIGVKFDDIGGLEDVKELLDELVRIPIRNPDMFNDDLLEPCRGMLLYGPPGTGKTMLAKAIASEAGASFINVSLSTITSKWFGEAEKNVRALFKHASKIAPTIIFIDEVDSLLGKRNTNGEHEVMRTIKNEFMTHWDGLLSKSDERILVLGSTNRPFDLDEAIIRRFECRIMVDLPSEESREKILKTIMSKQNTEELDFKELATMTEGYSGSDLKNLCRGAASRPNMELIWQQSKMTAKEKKQKGFKNAKIVRRPINMEDMRQAKNRFGASFASDGAVMNDLKQWHELYGVGGSRKEEQRS